MLAVLLVAAIAAWPGTVGSAGLTRLAAQQSSPLRFACYPAQFTGFRRPRPQQIRDDLSRRAAALVVVAPEMVCAPATPSERRYLTCYRTTPNAVSVKMRVSDDQSRSKQTFGSFQREGLCVSSTRVGVPSSTRAPSVFVCYRAVAAPAQRASNAFVADAFGRSTDSLSGPHRLCAPEVPTGSRAPVARGYLTCYTAASETKGSIILVRTDFGSVRAALGPRARVCVAATATRLER